MKSSAINKEIDELNFSFDDLHVIGVMYNKVFVEGWYFNDSENIDDSELIKCLLAFDKPLFHIALDHWINNKEQKCESYGHFCGVGGRVICTSFNKIEEEFSIYDGTLEKEVPIEAFEINYVEQNCDMEHG